MPGGKLAAIVTAVVGGPAVVSSAAGAGPDLLTIVLSMGLAAVGSVALVGAAMVLTAWRRDEDRRNDETHALRSPAASEIVDDRALRRARVRLADDPSVTANKLDTGPDL